jgi:hypothetical protein
VVNDDGRDDERKKVSSIMALLTTSLFREIHSPNKILPIDYFDLKVSGGQLYERKLNTEFDNVKIN